MSKHRGNIPILTVEQQREVHEWDQAVLKLGMARQLAQRLGISDGLLSMYRKRLRKSPPPPREATP